MPIAGRVADDLGREYLPINHLYTNAGARDIRLELRWAPADVLQPIKVSGPSTRTIDRIPLADL